MYSMSSFTCLCTSPAEPSHPFTQTAANQVVRKDRGVTPSTTQPTVLEYGLLVRVCVESGYILAPWPLETWCKSSWCVEHLLVWGFLAGGLWLRMLSQLEHIRSLICRHDRPTFRNHALAYASFVAGWLGMHAWLAVCYRHSSHCHGHVVWAQGNVQIMLLEAARNGNLVAVKELMQNVVDVNHCKDQVCTTHAAL
jgi:hypothetical protein